MRSRTSLEQVEVRALCGESEEVALEVFRVVRGKGDVPLVANIPHSSTSIPAEVRQGLFLSEVALQDELLRMTDLYTDELFSAAHELGGSAVIYNYSRLVLDPERFNPWLR